MIPRHLPAFANQLVKLLSIKSSSVVLDCTLGDGTHTQEALSVGAKVISLDVDPEAIERSTSFIPANLQKNWRVYRENFSNINSLFQKESLLRPDIILMDLGTSQYQLANAERGFSFQTDAPLDMRLDNRLQVTAKDLINGLSENELAQLFLLSDERYAKPIAKAITNFRLTKSMTTTFELKSLIEKIKPARRKINPATKVFQSLRMAVNLERENLENGLRACFSLLKPNGQIAVISFHSGEDRIVKHYLRHLVQENLAHLLSRKPLKPENNELQINKKIRSAKLRLLQKN